MKYYHMIIERIIYDPESKTRREYISPKQGSAPAGWKCVAVCGYHEAPNEKRKEAER